MTLSISGLIGHPAFWTLAASLLFAHIVISRFLAWRRLQHIPGPALAGWTDLWLITKTWRGSLFTDLGQLCNTHGPLARIAPNYVVCGDPQEVRRMWGVRSPFDRAPWYKGFRLDPPRDCSLSMRHGDLHTSLRSKLAPGYGGKGISGLHESIDGGVERFIRLVDEKYTSTATEYRSVDFARKVQYMTLDIISSIAFGEAFGFMDHDADLFGYVSTTEATVPMMQMFALVPWLVNLLQSPLCKAMMPSERDAAGLGPIMATAKRVVAQRYGPAAVEKRDMLGSFVSHGLSQPEAEAESLVQIIAGSDTTATVVRTVVVHVATNPLVYRRLQKEIDKHIGQRDSHDAPSIISDTQARGLPYLQSCIKEGLRIWPPITGIMPRISDQNATVCGIPIPAGTNVAWSAHAVMRSKSVFGFDAELFEPNRWLRVNGEGLQAMEHTIDLCFGQGRWGCLGRPVALMELNKMIFELFRRFDFTIVDAERPVQNEFYGVLMQSNLHMRITRR